MRNSNPFRYHFRQYHPSTTCIFKFWFGKKYFIWKAKALHQAVTQFATEIDRTIRLGKKDTIYEGIVRYVIRARIVQMEVEWLQDIDNPAELLKEEHQMLKKAEKDPDCINTSFVPMVPKWIPETAVKEYDDWRQGLQKKKRDTKKSAAVKRAATIKKKKAAAKRVAKKIAGI